MAPQGHTHCKPARNSKGSHLFDHGLVVDTRVFRPIAAIAPAKGADSGVPNMQHMAVVKDFIIPATPRKPR
jgi:hypothetical protein